MVRAEGTITLARVNDGEKGEQGIPGNDGENGRTSYLHIKYSDDGEIFTENNGEILGAYIGTLVDFNETDSTNFSDYTWKKFTEDVDDELDEIRDSITEQSTNIINSCEQIIMDAVKSYTETGVFETFKQTVESQLKFLADEMTLKFTETTQSITNINKDLQEKFNTVTKYFSFKINGLEIGQIDNPYKVIIDNDRYSMTVNGIEVLWFDGNGKGYIPELTITKMLLLFGYIISEDEHGNVNCEYIGG